MNTVRHRPPGSQPMKHQTVITVRILACEEGKGAVCQTSMSLISPPPPPVTRNCPESRVIIIVSHLVWATENIHGHTVVQIQTAVTANFSSKQLLPFAR